MRDPLQPDLFELLPREDAQKLIEYIAPQEKFLEQYAHKVATTLARRFQVNDPEQQAEFQRGFSAFVKTIVQIHVKHLNGDLQHE